MIKHIKNEVLNFLKSDKPGVMVIKGDWGTGKTYAWNEWLKEAVSNNEVSADQYSYVSLFGCNSLDELKAQTFEELIPISYVGKGVNLETILQNLNDLSLKEGWFSFSGVAGKLSKFLKDAPAINNFSVDVWRLGWLTIKNALVCVDDLERHGDGLRIKDACGLISILKERKNCKVILILNNETLKGKNKQDYEEYREKIIDSELHFEPEIEELVKLVFDEDYPYFDKIQQCVRALKVKNIRTIQKVKMYLDRLSTHLAEVEGAYYENVINSIVLFTVLHFSRPSKWPSLDDVLSTDVEKFQWVEYGLNTKDEIMKGLAEENDVTPEWAQTMNYLRESYTWNGADEIDQVLGLYVKQGYIELERLQSLIAQSAEDAERIKLREKARALHSEVRDVLYYSFDDNLAKVIKAMETGLQAGIELSSDLNHLNQYVRTLREINQGKEADKLINKYIKWAKKEQSNRLNLENINSAFSVPLDATLETEVKKAYEALRKKEIKEILKTIDREQRLRDVVERCPNYSLTEDDYEILSHFEPEDFEVFLRNTKIERKERSFLEIFLTRATIISCEEYHATIQKMLIKVVKKIADESELNKYRLRNSLNLIKTLEEQQKEV